MATIIDLLIRLASLASANGLCLLAGSDSAAGGVLVITPPSSTKLVRMSLIGQIRPRRCHPRVSKRQMAAARRPQAETMQSYRTAIGKESV